MATEVVQELDVEIVYALPDRVWRQRVSVPPGATLAEVIAVSDLFSAFPELKGTVPPLGVYGRRCPPDYRLEQAERVEVYRPLVYDPMESRRRRQRHREREPRRSRRLSDT